ncbi:DUF6350 family protein [Knoellia sp. CPCC 206435]|uniref:cell division protein PerM n=1 Tax=Knoellia terrae TaxID=3404797 RepID=UPI003B437ED8
MTVLELLRGVRPTDDEDGEGSPPTSWLPDSARDVLLGLATGLLSLLVVAVPTVLGWMLDPRPGSSFGEPLGAAASLWLLVQGAHLGAGATNVAFVPLVLGALMVWGASRGAGRALATAAVDDGWFADLLPRSVAAVAGRWWGGYAVAVGGAAALTLAGSLPLRWPSVGVPLLVVPALAVALALRRLALEEDILGPRLVGLAAPEVVRRASGPAVRGLAVLLGLGALAVAAAVVLRWSAVSDLQSEVGAGLLGGLLLTGAQLASLPNLALWVLSLVAGPGFAVVEGAHTSLAGSASGLMPLVPVFGAMPSPGDFPWAVRLLVLVPVLVGVHVGRRALTTVARLSSLRAKASVAVVACVMVAVVVGLLDGLGGGSLGAYRLSDIGAPALWLTLTLGLELVVGALLVVSWDVWRLRR